MTESMCLEPSVVKALARTYQDLCRSKGKTNPVTMDPPTLHERMVFLNIALERNRDLLPDGFAVWFNRVIRSMIDRLGEGAASVMIASLTDEDVFAVPFFAPGGDC